MIIVHLIPYDPDKEEFDLEFDSPYKARKFIQRAGHGRKLYVDGWTETSYVSELSSVSYPKQPIPPKRNKKALSY